MKLSFHLSKQNSNTSFNKKVIDILRNHYNVTQNRPIKSYNSYFANFCKLNYNKQYYITEIDSAENLLILGTFNNFIVL